MLKLDLQFFAKPGKLALVKISGSPIAFLDEATTTTDDKTYRITNEVKSPWEPFSTIVVEDAGIPTIEAFTLNRLTGEVTFGTVDNTRVITVSGNYIPTATVAEANEFSYSIEASNEDTTVFADSFMTRLQALKDFTGSLTQIDVVDQSFFTLINDGTQFVIEFFHDNTLAATEWDLRAWVILSSQDSSGSVDSIQEMGLDFEGTTDDDLRAVSNNP